MGPTLMDLPWDNLFNINNVFKDDKKGVACDPCRKSHVRCDRVKPACGVCTRRGIQNKCYGAKRLAIIIMFIYYFLF